MIVEDPQVMIDALDHFKILEDEKGKTIDPHDAYYWQSIALGYFIGKGFSFRNARVMADLYSIGSWSREKLVDWIAVDARGEIGGES